MVITVTVSDGTALAVVEFDLEPVADIARVIHSIEVVNRAVGNAGLGVACRKNYQASGANGL